MRASVKPSFVVKLLLVFSIFFVSVQSAYAETNPVINTEEVEKMDKPNFIEKSISKLLINLGNSLISLSKAQDVSVLVFQRPELVEGKETFLKNTANADRGQLEFGIFPKGFFDGIAVFYDFFVNLLPIPIVIIMVISALVLLFNIMSSPETRTRTKDILFGVIMIILLVRFGHLLWDWIIFLNNSIVDGVYLLLKSNGISVTTFMGTIFSAADYDKISTAQSIGVALLLLIAFFMTFVINYQYTLRMIILGILIMLFPIVILAAMIPSRRSALNTWFTLFTTNVLLQSAHALALGVFFYAIKNMPNIGFWIVLALMFGLPTIVDLVNRIIGMFMGEGGFSGGIGASFGNMSGLSNILALSRMTDVMFGRRNKIENTSTVDNKTSERGTMAGEKFDTRSAGDSSMNTDTLLSNNGNASGSAPIGSTLSTGGGRLARTGRAIAKGGAALIHSNVGRQAARTMAVTALAATGAVVSTMATGRASGGIAGASLLAGQVTRSADTVRNTTGRIMQLGGEILEGRGLKNHGEASTVFQPTFNRIGLQDSSQLFDVKESARIGQELIGGNVGTAIGGAVGLGNRVAHSLTLGAYGREQVEKLNDLNSIDQRREHFVAQRIQANQELQTAQTALNYAQAQYGSDSVQGRHWKLERQQEYEKAQQLAKEQPNNPIVQRNLQVAKNRLNEPHPELAKAQQNYNEKKANVAKLDYNIHQLDLQKKYYYNIAREAQKLRPLQQQVRSDGRL